MSEFAGNKPTSTGNGPNIPTTRDGAQPAETPIAESVNIQHVSKIVKILSADGKYLIVPGEASRKPFWGGAGASKFDGECLLIVPFVAIPNFPGETRLGSRLAVGIYADASSEGRGTVNSYARVPAPVPALMVAQVLMLMERLDKISPGYPLLALRTLNGESDRDTINFKERIKRTLADGNEARLAQLLRGDRVNRHVAAIVEAADGRGIVFNGAELSRLVTDGKIGPTHSVQNSIKLDQRFSFVGYGLRQEIVDLFKSLKPAEHAYKVNQFRQAQDFVRGGQCAIHEIAEPLRKGLIDLENNMPDFLAADGFNQVAEAFDGIRDRFQRLKNLSSEFEQDSLRTPREIPIAMYAQEFADGFLDIWSTLVRIGSAFRKPTLTDQPKKLDEKQVKALAEQERVTVKLVEVICTAVSRNLGSFYNQ